MQDLNIRNLLGVEEADLKRAVAQAGKDARVYIKRVDDWRAVIVEPGVKKSVCRKEGYITTVLPKKSDQVLFNITVTK